MQSFVKCQQCTVVLVDTPLGTPPPRLGTKCWHLSGFYWIASPPVTGFKIVGLFPIYKPWFDYYCWTKEIESEGAVSALRGSFCVCTDQYCEVFYFEGVLSSGFNLLTITTREQLRSKTRKILNNFLGSTALWWLFIHKHTTFLVRCTQRLCVRNKQNNISAVTTLIIFFVS